MSLQTDTEEFHQLDSNKESTDENIDKEFNIEILVKVVSSSFMRCFFLHANLQTHFILRKFFQYFLFCFMFLLKNWCFFCVKNVMTM